MNKISLMSNPLFDTNSQEFRFFYNKNFKPLLLKIQYANDYNRSKFKQRFIFSLNVIGFFILIQLLSSTIFIEHFHSAQEWYNNLIINYTKWYKSQSLSSRLFLPSEPFFFGFPFPWKFIAIAFLILPFLCISPFLQSKLNQSFLFKKFFQYIDSDTQTLNHQKLKYVLELNNNLTLPTHQNLTLLDNIEFQLNDHIIDVAQLVLKETSSNLQFLNFILPKYKIIYYGLIFSTKIPSEADRFIKIFIDHNEQIDFTPYKIFNESVFLEKNIEKRVKIFASKKEYVLNDSYIKEILQYADKIGQFNFASPIYFDQIISDKINNNTSESNINAYSYIEITIFENYMTILIPSNHQLLSFNSNFVKLDTTNDCNFLFASINLVENLIKKLLQ